MGWAKAFMALYPEAKIETEAQGSATVPPALLSGASQLAPMSPEELAEFEVKHHFEPTSFRVAIDVLAVCVNKDSPVACLSLPQLNGIFSSTRYITAGDDITNWGGVGLTGGWASKPISLYGRNDVSGTYEFFGEQVFHGGDYKKEIKAVPSSEAVVESVSKDTAAIGYSGIGCKTDGVRAVPLSATGGQCYDTSLQSTLSGSYPIARYRYVCLNKKADEPLDPLRAEFIRYILSKDGQMQTEAGGFYSITDKIREEEFKKLGLVTATK